MKHDNSIKAFLNGKLIAKFLIASIAEILRISQHSCTKRHLSRCRTSHLRGTVLRSIIKNDYFEIVIEPFVGNAG